jgi:predicted flap endonuclease-1-like 5' DNA nuclease
MRDGVFWGLMAAVMAATFGGAIAFVFATIYGAGWTSGGALGALVFLVAAIIFARSATTTTLPPPNTVKAPVAPPGGAFRAPPGGAFRMPGAPVAPAPPASAPPDPAPASAEDIGKAAGEAVGRAAYAASAAVTSAAQAAREAIAGVMEPGAAPAAGPEAEPTRPTALDAPRDGTPDDLKKIKGVGPKLEELLHSLGVYHFDQIAVWGPGEIAWVDSNLEGFHGRATRDDWVGQAKLLAAGGETEFSRRVEDGEVY